MTILVTGAAGFIGHHVAAWLAANHDVTALVRCGRVGDMNRLRYAGFKGEIIWHDLQSPIGLKIPQHDVIIHLGGETYVDESIRDPMRFVMANVVGTTNLLQFAREGCKQFIYFSTDEVFGPVAWGQAPKGEHDPLDPRNPYAATKAGAEMMVLAFGNTYAIPCMIVRSMNVFGERQAKEKFIPLCINKIMTGHTIDIHCSPDLQVPGSRQYTYVKNVCDALDFIVRKKYHGGPVHIVGTAEVDNEKLAHMIGHYIGIKPLTRRVDFHSSRPGHDVRYAMSDTILKEVGWTAPYTFETALHRTIDYYLSLWRR